MGLRDYGDILEGFRKGLNVIFYLFLFLEVLFYLFLIFIKEVMLFILYVYGYIFM